MVKTCEAKITREFKAGKANSDRPTQKNKDVITCGGDLTYSLDISGGGPCHCGDYCYCSGPEIHVDVECSRCKYPYFEFIDKLTCGDARYELARILNG